MPLTDTAVCQAKATGKNYTLKDTAGLALFVGAKGAKQWHFRFYWLGKQARISMGVYPAVSLKEAREARDRARSFSSAWMTAVALSSVTLIDISAWYRASSSFMKGLQK